MEHDYPESTNQQGILKKETGVSFYTLVSTIPKDMVSLTQDHDLNSHHWKLNCNCTLHLLV